jgi:hypothetical protein
VGFEPTISVLERAKTVRALDRAATVIGTFLENEKLKWKVVTRMPSISKGATEIKLYAFTVFTKLHTYLVE